MIDAAQANLFTRDDTFFGVCEALGEDFGIHGNWLRLAFAGAFFFAPALVVGVYALLGVAVALSRWMFPAPVRAVVEPVMEDAPVSGVADSPPAAGLFGAPQARAPEAECQQERELLPLAA